MRIDTSVAERAAIEKGGYGLMEHLCNLFYYLVQKVACLFFEIGLVKTFITFRLKVFEPSYLLYVGNL